MLRGCQKRPVTVGPCHRLLAGNNRANQKQPASNSGTVVELSTFKTLFSSSSILGLCTSLTLTEQKLRMPTCHHTAAYSKRFWHLCNPEWILSITTITLIVGFGAPRNVLTNHKHQAEGPKFELCISVSCQEIYIKSFQYGPMMRYWRNVLSDCSGGILFWGGCYKYNFLGSYRFQLGDYQGPATPKIPPFYPLAVL